MGFSANAQGLPKSPQPPQKEQRGGVIPEPWDSVMRGLDQNKSLDPDQFKPTGPLFPKGAPTKPDTPDAPSGDDLRNKTGDGRPYLGS